MNDEPISSRALIAAYRSQVRPSAAARERMLRNLAAPRPATPRPQPRPAAPLAWLALAAAIALICVSTYFLAGARHDAHVAPAEMMMAPQVSPPGDAAVTREPQGAAPHRRASPPGERPDDDLPASDAPQSGPSTSTDSPHIDSVSDSPHSAPSTATDSPHDLPQAPPARDASADPPRARPRAEPAGDQVLAELALIQDIKEALDADEPARALTLVERHARSFARGTLVEEREALRVVALCDAHDAARGPRAQQEFLRAYPRSAYRDRVRGACPADSSTHFP